MKKSIFYSLMSLGMLLFGSTAFAQLPAWPTTLPTDVVRADTIFICSDTVYPIEMGYDIGGLRLHPNFGDWTLLTTTTGAIPDDYQLTINKGNGGAGNAFKVVGSTTGGYIFQYEATDAQCELPVGKKFYAYVFILPRLNKGINSEASYCVSTTSPVVVTAQMPTTPENYKDLFEKAGITFSWATASWNVDVTIKDNTQVFTSVYTATSSNPKYKCGTTGTLKHTAFIIDSTTVLPVKPPFVICKVDTIGNGWRNPDFYLNRGTAMGGAYVQTTINAGVPAVIGGTTYDSIRVYEYKYKNTCGNVPKDHSVFDTMRFITKGEIPALLTASICRSQVKGTLAEQLSWAYSKALGGTTVPTGLQWYDSTFVGVLGNSAFKPDDSFLPAEIANGTPYYFKYKSSQSCMTGFVGVLGIIINDAQKAVDFRVQMCTDQVTHGFDLGAFTGFKGSALWTGPSSIGAITKDSLNATQLGILNGVTSKLEYTLVNTTGTACGASGKGVFYLKIGKPSIIPTEITEKFCKITAPSQINVNEITGYTGFFDGTANKWVVKSVSVNGTDTPALVTEFNTQVGVTGKYLDQHTGSFNFADAKNLLGMGFIVDADTTSEIVFELTGSTCIAGGKTTLTVQLVSDIVTK